MGRMSVLLISEAMVGGIREHVRQIVTHLNRDLFDVTLLCSLRRDPAYEQQLEELRVDGMPVILEPMVRSIRPWRDFRSEQRIYHNLLVRRYDVVHTHGSKAGILGRFAAHRAGNSRVIHTGHTFPIQWARGIQGRFYRVLERRAALWCDTVVALTQAQKSMLIEQQVCASDKIVVLPNAVELPEPLTAERRRGAREKLGLPPDAPVAAMLGRIVQQKDPLLFAQAAAAALRLRPDLHFVWIGDGPMRRRMVHHALLLGVPEGRLLVTGQRDDATALLPAADVLLMTTRFEGMPYAVLEAMAAGLPVVAVDVPGMAEIVEHGVTGRLTAADPGLLAVQVVSFAGDEPLRRKCGEAGRNAVKQRFLVQDFINKLQELYLARSIQRG